MNLQDLTISDKFMILIHRKKNKNYLGGDMYADIGLIGTIILDLVQEGKVDLEEGKLRPLSYQTQLSEGHQYVLQKIYDAKKVKKVKSWISKFSSFHNKKYRRPVLFDLERREIVQMDKRSFLFIPYYTSKLSNLSVRDQLIQEIREDVFEHDTLQYNHLPIIKIILALKLYNMICYDRREKKIFKMKVKEMIEKDSVSDHISKVFAEVEAAVTVSMIGAVVAVSS